VLHRHSVTVSTFRERRLPVSHRRHVSRCYDDRSLPRSPSEAPSSIVRGSTTPSAPRPRPSVTTENRAPSGSEGAARRRQGTRRPRVLPSDDLQGQARRPPTERHGGHPGVLSRSCDFDTSCLKVSPFRTCAGTAPVPFHAPKKLRPRYSVTGRVRKRAWAIRRVTVLPQKHAHAGDDLDPLPPPLPKST
jgi:hypothetical protein